MNRRTGRTGAIAVAAVALLFAVVTGACSGDDNTGGSAVSSSVETTATSTTAQGPPTTAQIGGPGALPLGTVTATGQTAPAGTQCPVNETCQTFSVSCPNVSDTTGVFGIGEASGDPKGVIAFFSGGSGDLWWDDGTPAATSALKDLQDDGYTVAQVKWDVAWSTVEEGQAPGFSGVACRSASVIKHLYDELYVPLGLNPAEGECGFCATGVSSGSSQVAYSMAFYGLAPILNAAILVSGPPHASIAQGCLAPPGQPGYDLSQAKDIDTPYGKRSGGPCETHDASFEEQWAKDSVDTGGSFYDYPTTRVVFIFGGRDKTVAPTLAANYVQTIKSAGTPVVDETDLPNMGHLGNRSPDGLAAITEALRGSS